MSSRNCSAFVGHRKIANGSVLEVALKVKAHVQKYDDASVLVFDDVTSQPIDLDLRGTARAITQRYEVDETPAPDLEERKAGPGRPKLGVVAREVTLLPRHWDWLATQPGGASVTLRKLVEEAKTKNQKKDQLRQAQDAAHRFMTAMTGDLPGYEEALRAFYARKYGEFSKLVDAWPRDLRDHVRKLVAPVMGD